MSKTIEPVLQGKLFQIIYETGNVYKKAISAFSEAVKKNAIREKSITGYSNGSYIGVAFTMGENLFVKKPDGTLHEMTPINTSNPFSSVGLSKFKSKTSEVDLQGELLKKIYKTQDDHNKAISALDKAVKEGKIREESVPKYLPVKYIGVAFTIGENLFVKNPDDILYKITPSNASNHSSSAELPKLAANLEKEEKSHKKKFIYQSDLVTYNKKDLISNLEALYARIGVNKNLKRKFPEAILSVKNEVLELKTSLRSFSDTDFEKDKIKLNKTYHNLHKKYEELKAKCAAISAKTAIKYHADLLLDNKEDLIHQLENLYILVRKNENKVKIPPDIQEHAKSMIRNFISKLEKLTDAQYQERKKELNKIHHDLRKKHKEAKEAAIKRKASDDKEDNSSNDPLDADYERMEAEQNQKEAAKRYPQRQKRKAKPDYDNSDESEKSDTPKQKREYYKKKFTYQPDLVTYNKEDLISNLKKLYSTISGSNTLERELPVDRISLRKKVTELKTSLLNCSDTDYKNHKKEFINNYHDLHKKYEELKTKCAAILIKTAIKYHTDLELDNKEDLIHQLDNLYILVRKNENKVKIPSIFKEVIMSEINDFRLKLKNLTKTQYQEQKKALNKTHHDLRKKHKEAKEAASKRKDFDDEEDNSSNDPLDADYERMEAEQNQKEAAKRYPQRQKRKAKPDDDGNSSGSKKSDTPHIGNELHSTENLEQMDESRKKTLKYSDPIYDKRELVYNLHDLHNYIKNNPNPKASSQDDKNNTLKKIKETMKILQTISDKEYEGSEIEYSKFYFDLHKMYVQVPIREYFEPELSQMHDALPISYEEDDVSVTGENGFNSCSSDILND